jgi:hypothetical protein
MPNKGARGKSSPNGLWVAPGYSLNVRWAKERGKTALVILEQR